MSSSLEEQLRLEHSWVAMQARLLEDLLTLNALLSTMPIEDNAWEGLRSQFIEATRLAVQSGLREHRF